MALYTTTLAVAELALQEGKTTAVTIVQDSIAVAAAVPTLAEISIPNPAKEKIGQLLAPLPDPVQEVDLSMTRFHKIFGELPLDVLQQILDFGRHPHSPGVGIVRNLPVDDDLPGTPADGGPSREKKTFVAEGVLLGLSGLLGEPVGYTTEKNGQLIHDVVPVATGATTQTNQGSTVFLNFHNDIVHDLIGRYDVSNPDFLVLSCLRSDAEGEAATYYADARDISRALDPGTLETLRSPFFRLNAPGSYIRDVNGGNEALSEPVPMISGPVDFPEISCSANGVRAMTSAGEAALDALQAVSRDVAHRVHLKPGEALLINNRKGLHARSQFTARYDGEDRWLQRTYVRRNQWNIRYRLRSGSSRVHI